MAEILDGDIIDFASYKEASEQSSKVKPASAWIEELIYQRSQVGEQSRGLLPWGKTHGETQLRPGELSIWAGINGHGKSLILGQIVLALAAQDLRCCIASFEMSPINTIDRLTQQSAGSDSYTPGFARRWGKWSDGRIWIYNQRGTAKPEAIMGLCRYTREKLGMDHLIIDSLMKISGDEDDYSQQKHIIGQLHSIAQDSGLHIHVVHHVRKGDDESRPPGKMALKGSGAITDQADNVWIVWRNKPKSQKIAQGKEVDKDLPDAMLICEKQRNGKSEPRYSLYFDARSTQFVGGYNQPIYQYVPDEAA